MRPKLKNKSDRYTENRNKYANDTVRITVEGKSRYNADLMIYATLVLGDTTLVKKTDDNGYLKFWQHDEQIQDTLTVELGKVPKNVKSIIITVAPDSEFSRLYDITGKCVIESNLLSDAKVKEFYDYTGENTKELTVAEIVFRDNGIITLDI